MTISRSRFFPYRSLFGAALVVLLAVACLAPVPAHAASGIDMYRLYNRYTGEHFYTASVTERENLRNVGWMYEGVGWVAPASGDPVYRLYNPFVTGGDHHYTLSPQERDTLVAAGWRYEGVAWASGGTVEVYRQYNPFARTGTHNYTTNMAENDSLVAAGWREEGVAWRGAGEGRGVSDEEFAERARVQLRVPDLPSITYKIYAPWYWEGAGITLRTIYFYQDGEVCAFASCTLDGSLARNIWVYTEP